LKKEKNMIILALIISLMFTGVGLMAIYSPHKLIKFARNFETPNGRWIATVVRVGFGGLLIYIAPTATLPTFLRVVGSIILTVGLITPFISLGRVSYAIDWWEKQGTIFTKTWAVVAYTLGLFLVYAISG
jgi:hypothetical protein